MDDRKVSGKTPIVSVILPTYNRAFTIRSSIESVLAQTYADFELIVVDDGSTDGTGDILKTIKDQRLKIIHSPENRGAAAARNLGIKASQADLIAFQDSDDLWAPHKLAVQVGRAAQAGRATGVIYSSFRWRRGKRQGLTPSRFRAALRHTGLRRYRLDGDLWQALLCGNFITTQTALVSKAYLIEAGGFDERLARLQDWDLWLRLSRRCTFKYINEPLVELNSDTYGISSNRTALIEAFEIIIAKHHHNVRARRKILAGRDYAMGTCCLEQGHPAQARRYFREALDQAPFTAAYWLAACKSLLILKSKRQACPRWDVEE